MTAGALRTSDTEGVVDEVAGAWLAPTTHQLIREVMPRFQAFCAAHDVPALPCSEAVMLAYLESRRPDLSAGTAKAVVDAVTYAHQLAGHARPSFGLARRYVQTLRRDPQSPPPQPRVDPLGEDEAEAMAGYLVDGFTGSRGTAPRVAALRAVAALARNESLTVRQLAGSRLHVEGDRVRLQSADVELVVSRDSVAHGLLTAAGCQEWERLDVAETQRRLREAGRRAGLKTTPGWLNRLSATHLEALLEHCDPDYERKVRDWAYLCMGIQGGLRHISLANVAIPDVRTVPGGFEVVFRVAKLQPGQVLVKDFRHLTPGVDACTDVLCAACAIERQLALLSRRGRSGGPLLATYYAGRWRVMTRQNGRLRVLEAWAGDWADVDKRIGTRTLRVTAASWASWAGMSILDIAEHVTNHRDPATCARYVHRHADLPDFQPNLCLPAHDR